MNKLINYKPFHFLCCLIVGIILQYNFKIWSSGIIPLISFLILLVVFLILIKNAKVIFTVLTFISFASIGILSTYIHNTKNYSDYYQKYINTSPVISVLKISKVLKPTNYYNKYYAEVIQINKTQTRGSVLVKIPKGSATNKLEIGNKLLTKTTFKEIPKTLNPFQFDYKKHLAKQGIQQQLFLSPQQYISINNTSYSLINSLTSFRIKIQTSLNKCNFNKDELDIINAMLLGQRQHLSKELSNDYAKAGVIHILAISGLHIGILLLLLSFLFHPLEKIKHGRFIKSLLIILTLWLFALFTGLSASVMRATTMFTFIAIGNSLQKQHIIEHSLISSMLLILLIKPIFLFDVGFQLSYLAVFGIVWTQPLLYNIWKPKLKLIDKIWQLSTVSIAAQIGILPVSLYYFHQFPGLFILSNIIIIPLLSIILINGFIIILLLLFNSLPSFLVTIYSYILQSLNTFIHWISLQEEFLFNEIPMSFTAMLSFYFTILTALLFLLKKTSKRFTLALFSIIFIQVYYLYNKQTESSKKEFIIFHEWKHSIIGIRKGKSLSIFSNLDSIALKSSTPINSYSMGNAISSKITHNSKYIYNFEDKNILCVDSLGVYNITGLTRPFVLLQYNPKINLNRLIKTLKPQQIIVDGSNYKNNIKLWEQTCKKQKTPFYDTRKNGVFNIK